ncbi:hypothetical protein FQZ97_894710 [compost metagenome]
MSWSSSSMLRAISARWPVVALSRPNSSSPMRMRASGERSSCEALASSALCDISRVCTRSAAALKRAARKATSSCPCTGSRVDKSPWPQRSTPFCSASSRLVRRRTIGYAPKATASATMPSSQAKPNGASSPRGARRDDTTLPGGRLGRGSWTYRVWPSFIVTWNSSPWPGTRTAFAGDWPTTSPALLRSTISRAMRASRSCRSRSSAICHSQPTTRVNTATAATTASQMRRYRR